jgi:predicted DNA-binding transcriptional regulator YafY
VLATSGRLLALLSLLQARRDWPGTTLAERLEVSPRTVRRDVDRLRALGYPVLATRGPDGGYRLDAGAELPPLLFDDEQAVAVAVALQTATTSVVGIEEAALRALATVRQVMPARLRRRVDALQVTAVRPGRERAPVDVGHLLAIGAAVRAHEVLRFDYAPSDETEPPRQVEPHHLVTWGGRWYLVAWDLRRADWRTFRVDRMTPRTPTGPRFTPRPLPAPDVASYVAGLFRAPRHPCEGEAVLHVPAARVAEWVRG